MKVLIGAIGTSAYDGVHYRFTDGADIESRYFIHALAQHIQPERAIVLLTEDARILQWDGDDELADWLRRVDVEPVGVDIPNGANEVEAWAIFDAIAESVPEGAEVYVDVTNGLRSIPTLLLSAMRYLERAKNVTIAAVYYGAFDATDRNEMTKPVYSLQSFLTLLDWAGAVQTFNRTGNLALLADLLDQRQSDLYRHGQTGDLPTRLKRVARAMNNLATALDLARPQDVLQGSAHLVDELARSESEFPQWAKPFNLLLAEVRQQFSQLALRDPDENVVATLSVQRALIDWYLAHDRHLPAALLTREWFVSWYMWREGGSEIFSDTDARREIERQIGVLHDARELGEWSKLWQDLTDLRNDIAHVGMRRQPTPPSTLKKNIQATVALLPTL